MFKKCPKCQKKWNSIQEFIRDSDVEIIGYQANFSDALNGFFLFNHNQGECLTTFTVCASQMADLNPIVYELKSFTPGQEGCVGFCAKENSLEPCSNSKCRGTQIRKIIEIVKKGEKK